MHGQKCQCCGSGPEAPMFAFDANKFLASYQASHALKPAAADGLTAILDSLAEDPEVSDVRWAAYMLATVRHECAGRWQPIEEFGKGKGRPYGQPVTVADADGTQYTNVYYGRGYVQLTWKNNYDQMGRALGMGNALVLHPEHALEPATAYQIMSLGMRKGMFTGKSLASYIHDDVCDYLNARRIINRLDQAEKIQGYAQELETLLRAHIAVAPSPQENPPTAGAATAGGGS